jgi:hypothetical protein
LGGRGLSFGGIDATYAASVAIWRRILGLDQMQDRPVPRLAVQTPSRPERRPPQRARAKPRVAAT